MVKFVVVFLTVFLVLASLAFAESSLPQEPTDWNLYMLRLVNAARTDPAGEDLRRGTSYGETPTHPLAYDLLLGRAAQNHSEWMGANRDNNWPPASFSHTEWSPSTGFTGAGPGDRATYTGYNWDSVGENILIYSINRTINQTQMDADHTGWWNSSGHRANIMNSDFTAFGHHPHNDTDGTLPRRYWDTQAFGRPAWWIEPANYFFGVIYDDKNTNGQWDPFNDGDPNRESHAGVLYKVYDANTTNLVDSGETFANGAYSLNIADGTYDILFDLPGLAPYALEDQVMAGVNVNLGDIAVSIIPGDANGDGSVDVCDLGILAANYGGTSGFWWYEGDFTRDGAVDISDLGILAAYYGTSASIAVPEPSMLFLIVLGTAALVWKRRGRLPLIRNIKHG
ncbi:MAG: PEP-CTERM sorting domain-containing protein [Pirellulales bacterium]|nr:PEP-CTERM sorting domain-containing protein [Pirellulales bacterium]